MCKHSFACLCYCCIIYTQFGFIIYTTGMFAVPFHLLICSSRSHLIRSHLIFDPIPRDDINSHLSGTLCSVPLSSASSSCFLSVHCGFFPIASFPAVRLHRSRIFLHLCVCICVRAVQNGLHCPPSHSWWDMSIMRSIYTVDLATMQTCN